MENLIDSLIEVLGLKDAERTNESGCTIYTGISASGVADLHEWLNVVHKGSHAWIPELDWGDAYRAVWVSIFHRCTLTYCEGDLTLSIAPDAESFYNELASSAKFYKDN